MTNSTQWNARGVRLSVFPTPQGGGGGFALPPISGFASTSTGCMSFEAADNMTYSLRVYYETKVGVDQRLTVRGYHTRAQADANTVQSVLITGIVPILQGDLTRKATVVVGTGADNMAISMAAATHTLHRVDTALTAATRPNGSKTLEFVLRWCQASDAIPLEDAPADAGSCYEPGTGLLWLHPGNGSPQRKYVIAHEVGHYLDRYWGEQAAAGPASPANAGLVIYGYANQSQQNLTSACRFEGQGAHAMHSQEYQRGAIVEGFAHYWATYAFNVPSPGTAASFAYYKTSEPDNGGYSAETYSVTAESGFPLDYVHSANGCDCVTLGNCVRTSTELQWMRGYWRYTAMTVGSYAVPTLAQFFTQMRDASWADCGTNDRCHKAMHDAAPTTTLRDRWDSVSTTMGLNTDQP